ncbi:MAG TPA: hypothetical protein VE757_04855 [Gaiellaceae bacterium]|nr:hypothetical protein [Gaiellaceae bacterium]
MKKTIMVLAAACVAVGIVGVASGATRNSAQDRVCGWIEKGGGRSTYNDFSATKKHRNDVHFCLVGKSGALGAPGAAGPQGPQGSQGPKGDAGAQGLKGDIGPAGPQGPKGDPGANGANGISGYEVRTWRYSKDDANSDSGPNYPGVGGGAIATVACSPGKVALGGGYWFTSKDENGFNSQALSDGSGVVASFPGRMDWSTNSVKPNDHSGWIVQVNRNVNAADMTLYVICADVDH